MARKKMPTSFMTEDEEKKLREYPYLSCRSANERHHWDPVSVRSSEYLNGHVDRRDECGKCTTQRLFVLDRRFHVILRYYFYPPGYHMPGIDGDRFREAYVRFELGWTD